MNNASALIDIERDDEGFLLNPADWNETVMHALADEIELELDARHIDVMMFVRRYYDEHQSVPEARKVLKFLRADSEVASPTMRYLSELFPYGYGQQACKLAGMRKPLKLILDV